MSRTVDISEAKANLSKLVDATTAGEEIILALNGRPLARLIAYRVADSNSKGHGFGSDSNLVFPDDFDRPLPAEVLDSFSR